MASTYELIIETVDKTGSDFKNISGSLKQLETRSNRTAKALKTIGGGTVKKSLGALSTGLKGSAAAAVAASVALVALGRNALNTLDSLGKISDKLGVSTEFLSAYRVVADRAGLSTEQFDTGLQRFLRRLGQAQTGTGELVKPLKELGINMKNSNGEFRDGTEVFQEFLTKLNNTSNESRKLALAMGAFDTEGVAFINIASMGADAIERIINNAQEAGLVLSRDMARGAAKANDALGELFQFGRGLQLNFFSALAPDIERAAEYLRTQINSKIQGAGGMRAFTANLAADFLEGLQRFVNTLATTFDAIIGSVNSVGNILKQIIVSISKIPGSGFDAAFGDETVVRAQLEFDLQQAQAAFDAIKQKSEDLGFFGRMGAGQGLALAIADAEAELNKAQAAVDSLNNGSTILFTQMPTEVNTATQAVAGFNGTLDASIQKLRDEAAASAAANTARIQSNILRDNENAYLKEAFGTRKQDNDEIKRTGSVTTTASTALQSFAEFYNKLTKRASESVHMDQLKQQALKRLVVDFDNGRISAEQLAKAMDSLGVKTAKAKEEVKGTSTALQTFSSFYKDLNTSIAKGINQDQLRSQAAKQLVADFDAQRISAEQLKEGLDQLGFSKPVEPPVTPATLTATESLIERLKEEDTALKDLENSLKNVSQLSKDTGIAQDELTEALKGAIENIKGVQEETDTLATVINDKMKTASETLASDLARSIAQGKNVLTDFKNFFGRILEDITQEIIRRRITQPLVDEIMGFVNSLDGMGGKSGGLGGFIGSLINTGAGGGSGGGGNFIKDAISWVGGLFGGKANGGIVRGGQPYVVGERGSELFVPNTTGSIVPREEMSAGGDTANITFQIQALDTKDAVSVLVENRDVITSIVSDSFNKQGRRGIVS